MSLPSGRPPQRCCPPRLQRPGELRREEHGERLVHWLLVLDVGRNEELQRPADVGVRYREGGAEADALLGGADAEATSLRCGGGEKFERGER